MDGEFRVQLKEYKADKIVQAFIEYYGDNLAQAYSKSAYRNSGNVSQDECPLTGIYRTKRDALRQIFEDQREKLFFLPISTILAIALTVYLNITDKGDAVKDAGKAVTSTLESVIVFLILFLVQWLSSSNKRVFTFKI